LQLSHLHHQKASLLVRLFVSSIQPDKTMLTYHHYSCVDTKSYCKSNPYRSRYNNNSQYSKELIMIQYRKRIQVERKISSMKNSTKDI
jgi:hypothetical protein